MNGQTLKIAAAGCFAMVILSTAIATRFESTGSFANVFTSLGGVKTPTTTEVISLPTVPEWESSLSKYTTIHQDVASGTVAFASSSDMNMTDTFARSMFEAYLLNHAEISTDQARQQFGQEFADTFHRAVEPTAYTLKDVAVTPHTTLALYIVNIANIIGQSGEQNEHELVVFERLMQNSPSHEEDIAILTKIVAVYQKIENELRIVPVPKDLAKSHLDLVNAITGVRTNILNMQVGLTDPLRAAAGLQGYLTEIESLRAVILIFQLQANVAQITFPENTPGWVFMNI